MINGLLLHQVAPSQILIFSHYVVINRFVFQFPYLFTCLMWHTFAGSNPSGGMDVSLFWVFYVFR